ncbi:hypothetical protein [Paraburkholderia kirstenboschensis]|uniref:Uncharacterized protein n=1 Tax=Paraburkholderia kirstenboschensis TaxID=1245436 RepID=A0ABZ0E8R3_9BURK|nr:hypothetical protein [Paraburkholderia kirstenboschensis]WOD13591.1 hypothetical protein RW095_06250 [Paraburkholderia kirstenboschensis]
MLSNTPTNSKVDMLTVLIPRPFRIVGLGLAIAGASGVAGLLEAVTDCLSLVLVVLFTHFFGRGFVRLAAAFASLGIAGAMLSSAHPLLSSGSISRCTVAIGVGAPSETQRAQSKNDDLGGPQTKFSRTATSCGWVLGMCLIYCPMLPQVVARAPADSGAATTTTFSAGTFFFAASLLCHSVLRHTRTFAGNLRIARSTIANSTAISRTCN